MSCNACDIIIPVWNQLECTKKCIESILKNTYHSYRLIIVDNGSQDRTSEYFSNLSKKCAVKYIRNQTNLGTIVAINQGIKESAADYLCIMHNDVIIYEEGWLWRIIKMMEEDSFIGIAGLAGRQIIDKNGEYKEGTLIHNLSNQGLLTPPIEINRAEVAVIDGLCFVIRRKLLDEIGGLDERYGLMHFYDLDLSLESINAGYKNIVIPISALHINNGGNARKTAAYVEQVKSDNLLWERNKKIFLKKWKNLLPVDKRNKSNKWRSLMIAWVISNLVDSKDYNYLLNIAKEGHIVYVFKKTSIKISIPKNQHFKVINCPNVFFIPIVLWKVIRPYKRKMRRKKFDFVFSNYLLFNNIFRKLSNFCDTELVYDYDKQRKLWKEKFKYRVV
ncbi:MAG: glycosyltransferase [Candidatus Omnitrophica bacterium]|nr:glycosyltransferase [Candidatus Omnitrophota bacterium]